MPTCSLLFRAWIIVLAASSSALAQQTRVVITDPLPPGAKARLGIPQPEAHEAMSVGGCTPDGALYVASAFDKEIRVRAWQATGLPIPARLLSGLKSKVVALALSGDGSTLAAADADGTVIAWALADGKVRLSTTAGKPVTALTLDAKGQRLAAAGKKGVAVYELDTGKEIRLQGKAGAVTALAFAPNAQFLAAGDTAGKVRLWQAASGAFKAELPYQPIANADAKKAYYEAASTPVKLPLQPPAPAGLKYVVEFGNDGVQFLAFAPDGKTLAAAGGTVVRLWGVEQAKLQWEHNRHSLIRDGSLIIMNSPPPPPHQIGGVASLLFSQDGKLLISTGSAHDIRFTSAVTGKEIRVQRVDGYYSTRYGVTLPPGNKSYFVFRGGRAFEEFDLKSGKRMATAGAHQGPATGVAFCPDGQRLASAGERQTILWDLAKLTPFASLSSTWTGGSGIAFSPNGKFLKSGQNYRGEFMVWELEPGAKGLKPWKKGHSYQADAAGFVPNEPATIALIPHGGGLRTLQLPVGEPQGLGPTVPDYPNALAVAPDGKSAVVGFRYAKAPGLLSIETGKLIRTLSGLAQSDVVAYSPDGRLVAAAGRYGDRASPVHIWDTATGKRYLDLHGHSKEVLALCFSPNGRLLASAGMDQKVHIWELATGKLLRTFLGEQRAVQAVAFAPKQPLLASAGDDGTVLLWDVSKELAAARPLPDPLGRGLAPGSETGLWHKRLPVSSRPGGLAFAPNGKTLAVGGQGAIHLLDPATGQEQRKFGSFKNKISQLLYSRDGSMLASCGYYFEGDDSVRLWETVSGKQLFRHALRRTLADRLAFSPDGKLLYNLSSVAVDGAGFTKGTVQAWNWKLQPDQPAQQFASAWGQTFALSPDGHTLLSPGASNELVLWDVDKGQQLLRRQLGTDARPESLSTLTFSGDSSLAASAGGHGIIRLWETKAWQQRHELKAPAVGNISSLVFSPNGRWLASGGEPNVGSGDHVRIWDAKSGVLLLTLRAHAHQLAWSPDSRLLATADLDPFDAKAQAVLLWNIATLVGPG